jgi:ribosomal protein S19E (S16A)
MAYHEWLQRDINEPSRSDWYLMGIAAEVRRVLAKNPGGIQPSQFRLKFTTKKGKKVRAESKADKEAREKYEMESSKALMIAIVTKGGKVPLERRTGPGLPIEPYRPG